MQVTRPAKLMGSKLSMGGLRMGGLRTASPLPASSCRRSHASLPMHFVRSWGERMQPLQAVSERDKRARYRDFTNQDSVEYWAIPQSRWIEEANRARAKQLVQLEEVKKQLQQVKPAADKTKQASRVVGKLLKRCKESKRDPLTKIEQHRWHWRRVEEVMDYHRVAGIRGPGQRLG